MMFAQIHRQTSERAARRRSMMLRGWVSAHDQQRPPPLIPIHRVLGEIEREREREGGTRRKVLATSLFGRASTCRSFLATSVAKLAMKKSRDDDDDEEEEDRQAFFAVIPLVTTMAVVHRLRVRARARRARAAAARTTWMGLTNVDHRVYVNNITSLAIRYGGDGRDTARLNTYSPPPPLRRALPQTRDLQLCAPAPPPTRGRYY